MRRGSKKVIMCLVTILHPQKLFFDTFGLPPPPKRVPLAPEFAVADSRLHKS